MLIKDYARIEIMSVGQLDSFCGDDGIDGLDAGCVEKGMECQATRAGIG